MCAKKFPRANYFPHAIWSVCKMLLHRCRSSCNFPRSGPRNENRERNFLLLPGLASNNKIIYCNFHKYITHDEIFPSHCKQSPFISIGVWGFGNRIGTLLKRQFRSTKYYMTVVKKNCADECCHLNKHETFDLDACPWNKHILRNYIFESINNKIIYNASTTENVM